MMFIAILIGCILGALIGMNAPMILINGLKLLRKRKKEIKKNQTKL